MVGRDVCVPAACARAGRGPRAGESRWAGGPRAGEERGVRVSCRPRERALNLALLAEVLPAVMEVLTALTGAGSGSGGSRLLAGGGSGSGGGRPLTGAGSGAGSGKSAMARRLGCSEEPCLLPGDQVRTQARKS